MSPNSDLKKKKKGTLGQFGTVAQLLRIPRSKIIFFWIGFEKKNTGNKDDLNH